MAGASELDVDLVTLILRIEQIEREPSTRDTLWERVLNCDVPRLKSWLTSAGKALLEGYPS